jgi:flagellar biosynthesis protein FlhB
MSSSQERTEKPTGKRLQDARKKGNIPRSQELTSAALILVGGSVALFSSHLIYDRFESLLHILWGQGIAAVRETGPDGNLFMNVMVTFFVMIGPVLLGVLVTAIGINVFQTKGLLISTETLRFDFSKVNPLNGIKRWMSLRSLIELLKSILKMVIVSYTVYSVLGTHAPLLATLSQVEIIDSVKILGSLSSTVIYRVGGIMLALSILDYYYQQWQNQKDLRMTKQEVKEEHKQTEGNPQIKSRIRSLQRAMARQRMMANIPKATVVITNPTHYAVALEYGAEMEAPKVVAKGVDFLAKQIMKVAKANGVPVHQNPPLARALYSQVKVDESIPMDLYKAVARVLAYIYQQKKNKPG